MSVEIRKAMTKKDFKKGVMLPFKINKGNDCWVPPLISSEINIFDKKKNASLDVCDATTWLAYKNGEVVGRVTGILNHPFIETWKKKEARFGWIDFVDDTEVSDALLDTVENWAKEQGMDAIVGPMGFSDFDEEGMLVEGFDELGTFAMLYNPEYYHKHLETRGYVKDADWVEYAVTTPKEIPSKVKRVQELVFKRNKLTLLDAKSKKDFNPYLPGIFNVLGEAYSQLYGYVALTEKQVKQITKDYFGFIDPKFTKVVLDGKGEVAAVGISMPSLSRAVQKAKGRLFPFGFIHLLRALKKPEILDLYLVAVRPELQNLGVNAILMNEITQSAIEAGIKYAETLAELEDNTAVRSFWKHYDARQHKRRRVYKKVLK